MDNYTTSSSSNDESYHDITAKKLLEERIIFLTGDIDDKKAETITAQLLYFEAKASKKDISIYINSPGGFVHSGLAIYDTMQYIKPDVSTICLGEACSMASLLLMAGTKGKRYILPHARVMTHEASGGYIGNTTDIEIHTKSILSLRDVLESIYVQHTGKSLKHIKKIVCRDTWMSPEEAKKNGLVDKILKHR